MDDINPLNRIIRESRGAFEARFRAAVEPMEESAIRFDLGPQAGQFRTLLDRLANDALVIIVLGRFNVGKSTFINLMTSTALKGRFDHESGLMPVDSLPSTPVLTIVTYGPDVTVKAHHFDGTLEPWTLQDYRSEARLHAETFDTETGAPEISPRLIPVEYFEITVPLDILRSGVKIIDSPGLSEDPRRTAITLKALGQADAAIFMFRSNNFVGTDEIEALKGVLSDTGHCRALVNLFGEEASPRLQNGFRQKLLPLWEEHGDRFDPLVSYVDCAAGIAARREGQRDRLEAAGVVAFEEQLGRFLTDNAYATKKNAALIGAELRGRQLSVDLATIRSAATADVGELEKVLADCEEDLSEIDRRRDRVLGLLEGVRVAAAADVRRSFHRAVRDIALSIDGRFAETPLRTLQTTGGKLTELIWRKASKEAAEILNEITQASLEDWATASEDLPGLKRDLARTLQASRHQLEVEIEGIDRRLSDINLRIRQIDAPDVDPAPLVSLKDRLISGGIGFLMLGPLGFPMVIGGWRSIIGTVMAGVAAKLAIVLIGAVLGITLAPVVLAAIAIATLTGGSAAGALYEIERRVRESTLEAFKSALQALETNEEVIGQIIKAVDDALIADGDTTLAVLDEVLDAQRQNLETLRSIKASTFEERRAMAQAAAAAERVVARSLETLKDMRTEVKAIPAAA